MKVKYRIEFPGSRVTMQMLRAATYSHDIPDHAYIVSEERDYNPRFSIEWTDGE